MKNKQYYLTIPFILIELVLMILVCFDITGKKIHSYVAIIICFLFSLIFLSKNKNLSGSGTGVSNSRSDRL